MHWIYFDASALIKRYSQETGTPLVNEVFRLLPRSRMTCSTLGILEIVSMFSTQPAAGSSRSRR